jgi:hypothetical protein
MRVSTPGGVFDCDEQVPLLGDAEVGALSHAELAAHLKRVQQELLGRVRVGGVAVAWSASV